MAKSLTEIAWEALQSEVCACGAKKDKKRSFCPACYFALPKEMQFRLYKTFSQGYSEIYDEAKDWLKINTERFNQKGPAGTLA